MIVTAFNTCMFSIVLIEDRMSDWHSCQICFPLEIKLLLLLLLLLLLSVIGDCSNELVRYNEAHW